MKASPPEGSEARLKLWTIFSFVLIGTPTIPFLIAWAIPQWHGQEDLKYLAAPAGWISVMIGAIVCGRLLAKLTAKTADQLRSRTAGFSFLFLLFFGIFAFGGCAVILFK